MSIPTIEQAVWLIEKRLRPWTKGGRDFVLSQLIEFNGNPAEHPTVVAWNVPEHQAPTTEEIEAAWTPEAQVAYDAREGAVAQTSPPAGAGSQASARSAPLPEDIDDETALAGG